jgi:hypothetical protein
MASSKPATATKKGAAAPDPQLFFLGGGVLAVFGVASLIWLYMLGLAGSPMTELLPLLKKDFSYLAMPGVLFLLAGVPLFLAVMFRGARWSARDRTFWQGGSVAIEIGLTPLPAVLLWLLVPIAVYVPLIPVPVVAETNVGAFGDTVRGASPEFWILVSIYGFLAAGTVGIFLASLLKRATYRRLAAAHAAAAAGGTDTESGGSAFWRLVATQWRAETFLSFIGFGLFGVLPLLWHDALAGQKPFDDTALVVLSGVAVGCTVLAVVTVLNAWRSGEPYGLAESVA